LLLDTRIWAHNHVEPNPLRERDGDARSDSSLEWAISATASIGSHLIHAGREVGLISQTTSGQRHSFASGAALADHLAQSRVSPQPALNSILPAVRVAARESTVLAVLGRVDELSLTELARSRPRGAAVPSFALVLDPRTWEHSVAGLALESAADHELVLQTLRAAGWWALSVEAGQGVPQVWTRLLSHRGLDATRTPVGRGSR
jgi:hypothetical protein